MKIIKFHIGRWTMLSLDNNGRHPYQRLCIGCDKLVGDRTYTQMLNELSIYDAEDGCCEFKRSQTEQDDTGMVKSG